MGYNILVVDDSEIIRSVIKKAIGMSGLEIGCIFEAANGREALERLGDEWVDIVLTDVNMPIMNGVELMARLASDEELQRIPVVIVSTERSRTRIDELMTLGARAYLKKPFRPEEFRDTMALLLGGTERRANHG
jgi:two-component system chemotaxis response regulator CheY